MGSFSKTIKALGQTRTQEVMRRQRETSIALTIYKNVFPARSHLMDVVTLSVILEWKPVSGKRESALREAIIKNNVKACGGIFIGHLMSVARANGIPQAMLNGLAVAKKICKSVPMNTKSLLLSRGAMTKLLIDSLFDKALEALRNANAFSKHMMEELAVI